MMNSDLAELRKDFEEIFHLTDQSYSNESLDAVVAGLDLTPEDSILAIAGAGDQAFAMLEFGCKVTIVDFNKYQIKLIKLRVEALRNGRYELFLKCAPSASKNGVDMRRNYFSSERRLDKIRKNLENLTFLEPQNIFYLAPPNDTSKIYLSNILDWASYKEYPDMDFYFKMIAEKLPINGLIYITSPGNDRMISGVCSPKMLSRFGLNVAEELTSKARNLEESKNFGLLWVPVVYRKSGGENDC